MIPMFGEDGERRASIHMGRTKKEDGRAEDEG